MSAYPQVYFVIEGIVLSGVLLEKGSVSGICKVRSKVTVLCVRAVYQTELDATLALLAAMIYRLPGLEHLVHVMDRVNQLRHEETHKEKTSSDPLVPAAGS